MDIASTVLGAFAGGGVLALFMWLTKLLKRPAGASTAPTPGEEGGKAVEAVRAVVVEEHKSKAEMIREALGDPNPDEALAELVNKDLDL